MQVHENELARSLQVPPLTQGVLTHSSIANIQNKTETSIASTHQTKNNTNISTKLS